jgi:hypothetical protein
MERFQKCKNIDKPVCQPEVKYIASFISNLPVTFTDQDFKKAEEACLKCEHYKEKE